MCSNTSTSPWHRHSAFSPGRLVTYRMFEWGNVTTRQWSSTSSPAMRAFATPKSICATPSAQTSSPVPVGTAPVRLAPASHVPRRRRVLAVLLGLRAEPVMHAFGGVALLAGQHAVGLEPSVDQRRVRVDLGAPAPVRGRFRGHVVHVGVFRDRGAVHVRPPRDLRPGHSLTVQSPDILLFGHRYRHRPFLPERRRLQPADSFLGCVSGIYRHGGLVPVLVWAVIWCSFRWKPAAHTAEKQCRNCLRKIEAKHAAR